MSAKNRVDSYGWPTRKAKVKKRRHRLRRKHALQADSRPTTPYERSRHV
jgi:hypothetical protein